MAADIELWFYIYKLIAYLIFSYNDHIGAAFVTGLILRLMNDFLYRKVSHDLITGALFLAFMGFYFNRLYFMRFYIGLLLSFIEE